MPRLRPGAAVLAAVALLSLSAPVLAASTGAGAERERDAASEEGNVPDEADRLTRRGLELAEAGKFEEALARFEEADRNRGDDPEILNMLAYCQRKTGDLDSAFRNYGRALELKPDFPQAREYLGEAHLQAALLQLEILRGYGRAGEQELWDLVAAIRQASAELDGEAVERQKSGGGW